VSGIGVASLTVDATTRAASAWAPICAAGSRGHCGSLLGAPCQICLYGDMIAPFLRGLACIGSTFGSRADEVPDTHGIPGYLARPDVIAAQKGSYGPLQIGKPQTVDGRPG